MTRTERTYGFIERNGVRISFTWGVAEATLLFFVPDVAVTAVALTGLARSLRAAVAAVAGAVLGGLALYVAARWAGPDTRSVLDAIPAIPADFFGTARGDLAHQGGAAIATGPAQGIPYKIYVVEWALAGNGPLALALWTIPARAARIVPAALITWAAAWLWRRIFGHRRDTLLLAAYAAVWVAIYTIYFVTIGF